MDTSTPVIPRFKWPKHIPPLDAEQKRINDDFVKHWHEVLPLRFGAVEGFNHNYPLRFLPQQARFRTLELGAGIGAHIGYEDLSRQDYHCIELRQNMADEIVRRFPAITATVADCQQRTPYDNASFDRVVVVHVLEHLPDLPACLDEVNRLLKPGGLFSVVLPCDPGMAYGLARKISAERIFKKRYNMPYGWFIGREHINSPDEILTLMTERFDEVDRTYFPLRVPVTTFNLCIGTTMKKRGG
jgi:SAM-dependent methyltransferase